MGKGIHGWALVEDCALHVQGESLWYVIKILCCSPRLEVGCKRLWSAWRLPTRTDWVPVSSWQRFTGEPRKALLPPR